MSPDRSVRQLIWVFKGRLLYAPATVKITAYTHTITTESSTANLPNMILSDLIMEGMYCNQSNITLAKHKRIAQKIQINCLKIGEERGKKIRVS